MTQDGPGPGPQTMPGWAGDVDGPAHRIDDPELLQADAGEDGPMEAAPAPGSPATGEADPGDGGPRLPQVPGKDRWADTEVDLEKARYEARLQVAVQQWRDQVEERRRTEDHHRESERRYRDAGITVRQAAFQAHLDLAKDTLARSLARAELVVKAAAGIGTVYTAVIGVAFRGTGRPQLPTLALWPTAFLAASLFLAAVYIGLVRRPTATGRSLEYPVDVADTASPSESDRDRAAATYLVLHARHQQHFVEWAVEPALRRAWSLRASILCLGMALLLLPLPFVALSASQRLAIPLAALLLFAAVVATVELLARWPDQATLARGRIEGLADALNRGSAGKVACLFAEDAEVDAFGDRHLGLDAITVWAADLVTHGVRIELRDLEARRDPAAPTEITVTWRHVEMRASEPGAVPAPREGAGQATVRNGGIVRLAVH